MIREELIEDLAEKSEQLGRLEQCVVTLAVIAFGRGDEGLGRALCDFQRLTPVDPDDELFERALMLSDGATRVVAEDELKWWRWALGAAFGDPDYAAWAGPVTDLLQRRVAS
jgi:hypothetical protein